MTPLPLLRQYTPLLRRYAPLAAVVIVQLMIVALVPSKPLPQDVSLPPSSGTRIADVRSPSEAPSENLAQGASRQRAVRSVSGSGSLSAAPVRSGTAVAKGDRSHCKGGRQFDGITIPPPCVPKWTGSDNGGATYSGVTAKTIKVVRYNQRPDPALEPFFRRADLASSDEEENAFLAAAEKYINARFELYGRKIEFETWNSPCDPLPPKPACFRGDIARLVETKKPFFVVWNTPLSSAAFDELSARKVLNAGGWQFSGRFSSDRRPYHWDAFMSGSRIAEHVGEYWCKKLADRKPTFAGPDAGKFDPAKARVLGVITADDPANQQVLRELQERVRRCGGGVKATYFFKQDPDHAAEQINAGLERMIKARVTTLVCLCDAATPYFVIVGCDSKNYHPEHIVPGTGLMDFDAAGRLYVNSTQWRKGPTRLSGAFGIGSLPELEPYASNDALRVWRAAGNSGQPYNLAIFDWLYYDMVATLIQMAGPTLTPSTVESGAFAAGYSGGWTSAGGNRFVPKAGFGPNDYTWIDDVREVVWSATSRSRLDGKDGTYISLNGGRRYDVGQWPAGEPKTAGVPP